MTHSQIINMISLGFCTWVAIVIGLIFLAWHRNALDPDWEDDEDWDDDDWYAEPDWDDSEEQRRFEQHWEDVQI
jgi:hypothetical protein